MGEGNISRKNTLSSQDSHWVPQIDKGYQIAFSVKLGRNSVKAMLSDIAICFLHLAFYKTEKRPSE